MQEIFSKDHLVYLVDDEPSVVESLGRLLRTMGLRTREFLSGGELLADGRCSEADCFILDVHMPEMDGYELVARLRDVAPASPVILITAKVEERDRWREKAGTALALLIKPASEEEFIAALRQALEPPPPPE